MGRRDHVTSTVPGIEPWILTWAMGIWLQSHRNLEQKGILMTDWRLFDWQLNRLDRGEWTTRQLSLPRRRREYLFCSKDLAPGVCTKWLSRNPSSPCQHCIFWFTAEAFCVEHGNICHAFCPNVISTAFCSISSQGKHTPPNLEKHPNFPLW